ncbi:MAG: ATP-dependent Clp protease ATP-binding subunit [Deltaproteobacteria bacterium]|nr:MAG: ATP-dependent Clp protease ATP-binding subunit [Deltaproteobacteria bacterium]
MCGAEAVDCLHLLIALCAMRGSLAMRLLERAGLDVFQFRNLALSYAVNPLPRRLTVKQSSSASASTPSRVTSAVEQSSPPPPRAVPLDRTKSQSQPPLKAPAKRSLSPEDSQDEEFEEAVAVASHNSRPPTEWDLEPTKFPVLERLGRNLTALAALGRIDPLIGRERELTAVIDTLLKRRANNPLLVGEPGVGKTAIVEGLARAIVTGDPRCEPIRHCRIVELDVASLLSGTQLRGAFSEKLQQIRKEVRRAEGSVVVFFDEFHTLIGAGATGEGAQDAANELKAALARGEFPCIGATTHDEFRRFVEQDAALVRRFNAVQVPEPDAEQTLKILTAIAEEYARHHKVSYDTEALEAAVELSSRYITDRCLPDKAISLLDLAGSRARRCGRVRVDRQAVARVVASLAQIPVERLLKSDGERLLNMEKIVGLRLIGHTAAVRAIADVIRRNYVGFRSRRPVGSFLFLGPTGVGKTECARVLAWFLFGSRDALVKLDMSEYAESHSLSRMIGAPPGYVGYQEGGQLTDAVRRRPYSIVVFDEIEKAHPDVHKLLLQILEDGVLTDGKGRRVDFSNTVIVCTSNLGAGEAAAPARIGFGGDGRTGGDYTDRIIKAARGALPPELWGRFDEHLVFEPLGPAELASIAQLMLRESAEIIESQQNLKIEIDPAAAGWLVESQLGDFALGARPLRAAVRRSFEQPLAEAILAGRVRSGQAVKVGCSEDGLVFEATDRHEG